MSRIANEDRPERLNRANRPQRTPINGRRDVLNVRGMEPGWHYCWVNDYNVDTYLEGAYDFVTHSVVVGNKKVDAATIEGGKIGKPVGNGVIAYLMRCPDEVFQEEADLIEEVTDENDVSLRQQLNSKEDGRYGEAKIEESKPIIRRRGLAAR